MCPVTSDPVFRKLPPSELVAPNSLVDLVRTNHRSDYILDHGFTRDDIKPEWWMKHGIEITFPSTIDDKMRLTRGDLFAMADMVKPGDGLLRFMWHVLAWGSGDARRNNLRRIESCRANDALLWQAFESARDGDPRKAYGCLIRPGGAVIPQLGPAFFSKFLYFSSEGAEHRCLILDARVARGLYSLGWSVAPTYPTTSFSYNWHTETYVSYCGLLSQWAEAAGTADMYERALFDAGGR